MDLLFVVLRYACIGWIDWFFKSRRVVKWENDGLKYAEWPEFWKDGRGVLGHWRGVLIAMAVSMFVYDILVGNFFRASYMVLLFTLEFHFYWFWVYVMGFFGFQRQKQEFETQRLAAHGDAWTFENVWREQMSIFEVPANPGWLKWKPQRFNFTVDLVWAHDQLLVLIAVCVCAIVEIFRWNL